MTMHPLSPRKKLKAKYLSRMITASLRTHRRYARMSVLELSRSTGIPTHRLIAFEDGRGRSMNNPEVQTIARALGMEYRDLASLILGEIRSVDCLERSGNAIVPQAANEAFKRLSGLT